MSARYLGGIVSKDPLTLNPALGNAANGVFTMNQYMQAVKNATWPGFDPYFNRTVLSLHGNGTNGAQNNTFLDSSSNNFTITRNGNTTQGTFSPFSVGAGEWSNYFDGTDDHLTIASATALSVAASDFTIETWVYPTNISAINTVYIKRPAIEPRGLIIIINNTTGYLRFLCGDSNTTAWEVDITANEGVNLNEWNHIACTRSSNTFTVWLNGESVGSATPAGFTIDDATGEVHIGANDAATPANLLFGYLSNFRLVKGRAVYTSAFTPPTAPLGATSGGQNPPQGTETSLLTCQSNRFVDNSTNAFAITRNGDVRVTPFSPFAPTAAYSAGTNGGSGYFDGSGDYLVTPNNTALQLGTGEFTIEAWFYGTAAATTGNIISSKPVGGNDSTAIAIYCASGNIYIWNNGAQITATVPPANAWNHVAATRNSSNVLTLWVNGVSVGTLAGFTANLSKDIFGIGALTGGSEVFSGGYISSVRVLKGTCLYTGTFTPPTAPLTAISNTSLLLNFTNAGIIDNTGKNNLETVGNAQIDTTTKKFGTGSMEFDGSGDWLLVPKFWNIAASENFTIECWIYLTAAQASYRAIISDINSANLGSSKYIMISSSGLEIQTGTTAGTVSTITQSFSQNTWYHLAVVRSSGTISVYVDGVSKTVSQASQAGAFLDQGTSFYIGRWASTAYEFYGFIDDLRITKGVARYTANFTPQTSQWQDQ